MIQYSIIIVMPLYHGNEQLKFPESDPRSDPSCNLHTPYHLPLHTISPSISPPPPYHLLHFISFTSPPSSYHLLLFQIWHRFESWRLQVETAEYSPDGLTVIQLEPSVSVSDAQVLGSPLLNSEEVRVHLAGLLNRSDEVEMGTGMNMSMGIGIGASN